jgi:hypothetical protein
VRGPRLPRGTRGGLPRGVVTQDLRGQGFLVGQLPFLPGLGLRGRTLRVAALAQVAVALGAAAAGNHHVAVGVFAHAGHAARHLLERQAIRRAQLGQKVDVATRAHGPVQVARTHCRLLLVGHGPFGQVGIFVGLEARAVLGLQEAPAELVEPVALAALLRVEDGRAGHVFVGFVQGHGYFTSTSSGQ